MKRRTRQNVIIGIIGSLGVVLIVITLLYITKENRFNLYKNVKGGFSIKYPATWSVEENKNGAAVIFYSPKSDELDVMLENVNIVIQDMSAHPRSLTDYSKVAIKQMKGVFTKNMVILESGPSIFARTVGYKLDFLGKTRDSQMHYVSVWVIDGQTVYQATYTSLESDYETYWPKVKRMFGSFRIHKRT